MAWTHKVILSERIDGRAHVAVVFRNGLESVRRDYTVTSEAQLAAAIAASVQELTAVDGVLLTASPDAVIVPPVVVEPTPDEIAKADFLAAEAKLRRAKDIVALAGDAGAKLDLASLEADVVTAFKAEYLG